MEYQSFHLGGVCFSLSLQDECVDQKHKELQRASTNHR